MNSLARSSVYPFQTVQPFADRRHRPGQIETHVALAAFAELLMLSGDGNTSVFNLRRAELRALEAGMRFDVALVDTVPLGVDTPADLDRARALLAPGR